MAIKYRFDIIKQLKLHGYTTAKIRKDKLFSESTLQAFRTNRLVSFDTIFKLCDILHCDIGDIIHYIPDESAGTISSYDSSLSTFAQSLSTSAFAQKSVATAPVPNSTQEDSADNITNDPNDDTTNDDADSNDSPAPAARGITPDDLARLSAMFDNLKKH